jgi:DNA segregation ATPase FtsK/SpoIIIE-like protein
VLKGGFFYVRQTKQILTQQLKAQKLFLLKEKKTEKGVVQKKVFPKIYYKHGKEIDEFSFHVVNEHNTRFLTIGGELEEWLQADLIKIEKNDREFIKFQLLINNLSKRMTFDEVVADEDKITLMHGVEWQYRKLPHLLIVAPTGSGKTFLIYAIMKAFGRIGRVHIADPKRSDLGQFVHFKNFKHLVTSQTKDIFTQYEEAIELMEKRFLYMIQHENFTIGKDYSFYGMKPEFFILDEFAALTSELENARGRDEFGDKRKDKYDFYALLTQIVLKARQAGIFFIASTQQATHDVVPTIIRNNLMCKIVLGNVPLETYNLILGEFKEKRFIRKGEVMGRGYFYNGIGTPIEFFTPLFPAKFDPMKFWAEFPEMPFTDVSHIEVNPEKKRKLEEYLQEIEEQEEMEKRMFLTESTNQFFEQRKEKQETLLKEAGISIVSGLDY